MERALYKINDLNLYVLVWEDEVYFLEGLRRNFVDEPYLLYFSPMQGAVLVEVGPPEFEDALREYLGELLDQGYYPIGAADHAMRVRREEWEAIKPRLQLNVLSLEDIP